MFFSTGTLFDCQKFCRFSLIVINFIPTCFCASSLSASLGFCGCNRTWHKARDIVVTGPALSVYGSNTRCVKGNAKTNKCKPGCTCVSSTLCNRNVVPVWTRLPHFLKRKRNPLINPYPDVSISANERQSDLFYSCSFIFPNNNARG